MSWDRYLRLTWHERFCMHDALSDLIDSGAPDEPPMRPRDMQR